MEVRYFWVCDKVAQDAYDVIYYQSIHHIGVHHQAVRPWYLYEEHSPMFLPQATRLSTLKGCVGTLPEGYIHNIPLSRVPQGQSAQSHQATKIPDYYKDTHVVPTYNSPCSIGEKAAFAFSPAWHAFAINN